MHHVSGADLDSIASLGNSIHLTLFGVCAGAAISFWVVLSTTKVTDPMAHAEYVIGLGAAVVFSIYFGAFGVTDYVRARRRLKEIKNGQ